MSLPSHRLPPPVSQTVGGAAAAAVASTAVSDIPVTEASPAVADTYQQRQSTKVLRQAATGSSAVDPSADPAVRAMLPAKLDSTLTTARTTGVAPDSKRTSGDIPRLMRPQSVLKYYMKYLTPYEHQEIFNYSQV